MPMIQTDSQHYSDIADAIRDMSGNEETFYPSEMAAGVRSIPQTIVITPNGLNWDFTKSMLDISCLKMPKSTHNLSVTNTGLIFNTREAYFELDTDLLTYNMSYELQIASMDIQSTEDQHNRLIHFQNVGGTQNAGFGFRYQTQVWSVWDSVTGWQDSAITDKNFFNNSTLRLDILSNGKWRISKDNNVVFQTPNAVTFIGTTKWGIGSPNQSANNFTLKGMRIYVTDYKNGNNHVYTTTEQVIGTWIDGKPIYEKTYVFNTMLTVSNVNWTQSEISASSISQIIDAKTIDNVDKTCMRMNCYVNNGYVYFQACRVTEAYIRIATIQYTKTTD